MKTIHTYTAGEAGLAVNAYAVETDEGVVAVDATLTRSDSAAFRDMIAATGKPLTAVLLTHAHGDHVAGVTTLVEGRPEVPVIALGSIRDEMRRTEAAKHAQWGPVFGDEWISRWTYPTRTVRDGEVLELGGLSYRVHDLGPGGDSPANSIWLIEDESPAAFIGDLAFNGTHSYMADGAVLRWLANLERAVQWLRGARALYPGHGPAGGVEMLHRQRDYLLAYVQNVVELGGGQGTARNELERRMSDLLPGAPLGFMIGLSADAVMAELG